MKEEEKDRWMRKSNVMGNLWVMGEEVDDGCALVMWRGKTACVEVDSLRMKDVEVVEAEE